MNLLRWNTTTGSVEPLKSSKCSTVWNMSNYPDISARWQGWRSSELAVHLLRTVELWRFLSQQPVQLSQFSRKVCGGEGAIKLSIALETILRPIHYSFSVDVKARETLQSTLHTIQASNNCSDETDMRPNPKILFLWFRILPFFNPPKCFFHFFFPFLNCIHMHSIPVSVIHIFFKLFPQCFSPFQICLQRTQLLFNQFNA